MGWDTDVKKVSKKVPKKGAQKRCTKKVHKKGAHFFLILFPKGFMHQWQGSCMIVDGPVIQNIGLVTQRYKVFGCPPHL